MWLNPKDPIRRYKWSLISFSLTLISFVMYFHLQNAILWVEIVRASVFVASVAMAVIAMFKEPTLRYGAAALCLSLINFVIHASA